MAKRPIQVSADMLRPDRSTPAHERHADISSYFSTQNVVASYLPLDQIRPNPYQPRKDFPPLELDELAQSMREHGFLGALLARPAGDGSGLVELAYGERRWRAAQLAGLEAIPIYTRDLADQEMLEIALVENVLRTDLNPLEEAQGFAEMTRLFSYSIRELAQRLGKGKNYIEKRLFLLRTPADVQQMIREHPETVRAARPLAGIPDADLRAQVIAEVIAGRVTSDDVEDRAAALLAGPGAYPGSAAGDEPATGIPAAADAPSPSGPRLGSSVVLSPAGDSYAGQDGALPMTLRRDRLSIGYRALTAFFSTRRVTYDADTASKVRAIRDLCDRYLAMWEARGEQ